MQTCSHALGIVLLAASFTAFAASARAQPAEDGTVEEAGPASAAYASSGRTHPDDGLVIAGSLTLGLSYVCAIIVGTLYQHPLFYIPVVGGLVQLPVDLTVIALSAGIPFFAAQSVGLILLIVGLVANIPDDPPNAGSWAPRLARGPGELGATLEWVL